MSKQPERTEKDCLNCGELIHGRFCHKCGQENIVWKQGFFSLVKHFVYDLFHFDGKFFDTLKNLFIRPGFVPKEYISGKRVKYLDPIRMYLFTSAFFFIIFFSVSGDGNLLDMRDTSTASFEDRIEIAEKYEERFVAGGSKDSFLLEKSALLRDTTRPFSATEMLTPTYKMGNRDYKSLNEYDSVQKALPVTEKDNWFLKAIRRKTIEINEKYKGDTQGVGRRLLNDFIHKFPYMLFISLPFFAGILKLLYNRRKKFFYSDHAIFTIYHYIISFILLLLLMTFNYLQDWLGWGIFGFLIFAIIVWWFIYLYKSLKRFYEQGRGKTILKFFLLNFTGFILFLILFTIFLLISVYQL